MGGMRLGMRIDPDWDAELGSEHSPGPPLVLLVQFHKCNPKGGQVSQAWGYRRGEPGSDGWRSVTITGEVLVGTHFDPELDC